MTTWTLRPTTQAIEELGSRKLAAFHAARIVGIQVPEDAVLVPACVPAGTSLSEADGERLRAIAAPGRGKVVLRAIGYPSSFARRAFVTPLDDLAALTDSLALRTETLLGLYVQAWWPGNGHKDARLLTVTLGGDDANCPIIAGYQSSLTGTISPFARDDSCWVAVSEACQRLLAAIGISAQVVLGLSGSSVTLLSIRQSSLPLAEQIKVTLSQQEQYAASRGSAVVAISDALDAIGSQYHIPDSINSSAAMRGRSIGEGWVSGRVALSPAMQAAIANAGDAAILVRPILRAEDCDLFETAAGVVSIADGVSSHYALLASSLQKPCLVDMTAVRVQSDPAALVSDTITFKEGDWATIDERQGALLPGRAFALGEQVAVPSIIIAWANALRDDALLVNCEDPYSASAAVRLGADGIGLCRSERHLVTSPNGLVALQTIITSTDSTARDEATRVLCEELGAALEELLAAVPGKPLSYRLLEPAEILLGFGSPNVGAKATHAAGSAAVSQAMLRGDAFRSRFPFLIEAQIKTAVQAAINVATQRCCAAELAIVIPMVSELEEYRRWHQVIKTTAASVGRPSEAPVTITAGLMIETPRAAVLASRFAEQADVFLIGTNDLTALVWGMDRFSAGQAQTGAIDPFARFDADGVGQLLVRAIREAREVNPTLKISVCGSHASVRGDADLLLDTGASGLSCQVNAMPRIALQLARRAERHKGRLHIGLPEKSLAARRSERAFAAATRPSSDSSSEGPRPDLSALLDWAREIADDLSLPWTGIWKFFKRDLTAHAFGPREARRFLPGWQLDDALDYALSLPSRFGRRIRYSVFPADIACRSSSELFPDPAAPDIWRGALQRLDPQIAVEIFPQQHINRTAFRAVLRDMLLSIEGASGQAIDIFWKAPKQLSKFTYDGCTEQVRDFVGAPGFKELFEPHLKTLFAQTQALRDYLGVDWISLEGYAGPEVAAPLFIADLDLPLDSIFISTASAAGA
jgi:phosphoenolpyruvate-protein kinase (PTS system EI component)